MPNYPPGPKDSFLGLNLARRFRADPLGFMCAVGRDYGDLASFRMGPLRVCLVNSPQLIREVLVTKHKSFRRSQMFIGPLRKIDGNGLVLSEGDFWLRQRRLVQPAFAAKRFDGYAQVTVDYTLRMLDGWREGVSLDVADAMTELTLGIIAKTLFDVDVAGQATQFGEAVRVISQVVTAETGYPVHLPDWLPLPAKRRKRWAMRTLDEFVWNVIGQRRASGDDRGDLLSMLLLALDEEGDGGRMTDRQARDEAITLFNAGHDTTASALAWVWYLLGSHPAVEARLVEEVDSVLAGRRATYADVARLPYTEMVVKESLRLFPPAWSLFPREAVVDVELDGYTIPRRSWSYVFPYVTHRDARYFKNPEAFDPERFAPGRAEEIPPYAYIPFGAGPRVCIRNTFAMMEMILIVATVLGKFRLQLATDPGSVEPEPLLSIRPKGGLRVSLVGRSEPARAPQGVSP